MGFSVLAPLILDLLSVRIRNRAPAVLVGRKNLSRIRRERVFLTECALVRLSSGRVEDLDAADGIKIIIVCGEARHSKFLHHRECQRIISEQV